MKALRMGVVMSAFERLLVLGSPDLPECRAGMRCKLLATS